MPLYEYRCEACGRQIEVIQKFSDRPLTKCEGCGGKLRKLISQSGFVLKGSGWYVTDYKGGGGKAKKGDTEKSGGEKADKGGDKADKGATTDAGPSKASTDVAKVS
jgi:putative FmdB family regulatory protein